MYWNHSKTVIAVFLLSIFHGSAISKHPFEDLKNWQFKVGLGGDGSWVLNQDNVGASDTNKLTLGANVSGTASFVFKKHDWSSTASLAEKLSISEGQLSTATKYTDDLHLESTYRYRYLKELGFLAAVYFDTNILPNTYEGAATGNKCKFGSKPAKACQNYTLAAPFTPALFQEDFGIFSNPYKEDYFDFEVSVAASFAEIIGRNQFVTTNIITDANGDTVVNFAEIGNILQIGPRISTSVKGTVFKDKVTYQASLKTMYIAWQANNGAIGFLPVDKLKSYNFDITAGLSFHLLDWLSVDCTFSAIYKPVILEKWQLKNNVGLKASYTF